MYLALYRTLVLIDQVNAVCRALALMELYIWGMMLRGFVPVEPQDYDSRKERGDVY